MTPGHQPGHRVDHHERRRLAAGEHEVADRELAVAAGGRRPAGRRLRSGRRAARTRPAGELARGAPGRRAGPPPTAGTAAAAAALASTAANSGSGLMTMPAPPPNGASSTLRWRSVAWSRGSWSRTSSSPALARPPEERGAQRALEVLGEDREDVDAHSELEQAVGRVDDHDAVACSTTNTIGTSASVSSTSRSCAGFASTATTRAERVPAGVDDLAR